MASSSYFLSDAPREVTYSSFQEEMVTLSKQALGATHTRIGSMALSEDQLKALSAKKDFPYLLKLRSQAMALRPALYDVYAPTVARG